MQLHLKESLFKKSKNLQLIMAKRSQRRIVRYEKDQAGCMWGLISIFDFRYGQSSRKLLSDRRRGNRHAVGKDSLQFHINLAYIAMKGCTIYFHSCALAYGSE